VRVFSARLWAVLINRAGIVGLQKWAGELLEHPVAVLVQSEVLLLKVRRLEPEPFGDPVLVAFGPERAGGFAAVGTAQAIRLGKNPIVQVVHDRVEVPRRLPLEAF